MQRANIDDLPNPFSIEQASSPAKSTYIANGLKFFLLTTVLLATFLVLGQQYAKFRLFQLTADFAALPSAEKQERLQQLTAWGDKAIPTITTALTDKDDRIADRAHQLLRSMQRDWTVLEAEESIRNHKVLVAAIVANESALSAKRRELAVELLQAASQFSVDQQDDQMRQLYFAATAAIDKLTSVWEVDAESSEIANFNNIDVRKRPLPVDHLSRGVDWTDWPPRENLSPGEERSPQEDLPPREVRSPNVQAGIQVAQPQIHQTKSPLKAVPDDEVVLLRDVHRSRTHRAEAVTSDAAVYHPPTTIQPVAHVIETPWQDASVATIIRTLVKSDQQLQDQAKTELTRRGYSDVEISIGMQIATDNRQSKIALIESLSGSAYDIDVRPWLMMLLDDHDREVRLRAISALADMKDPWVGQQLRLRMADEKDQTVAFRIRRVLNLR